MIGRAEQLRKPISNAELVLTRLLQEDNASLTELRGEPRPLRSAVQTCCSTINVVHTVNR